MVIENLSFFSRPFWIFFLLHSYLNQSQINGVSWMGLDLYDYHDFHKNKGGYRIMKHTAPNLWANPIF